MRDRVVELHEEWRAVEGFELYEVSNQGRARSWVVSGSNSRRRANSPRILKGKRHKFGYTIIPMADDNGKIVYKTLHRVILQTFGGKPPSPDSDCRHLDGDPSNNRFANLAWGTRRMNCADMLIHGTRRRGQMISTSILSETDVLAIIPDRRCHRVIAEDYGVCRSTITSIKNQKNWRHLEEVAS